MTPIRRRRWPDRSTLRTRWSAPVLGTALTLALMPAAPGLAETGGATPALAEPEPSPSSGALPSSEVEHRLGTRAADHTMVRLPEPTISSQGRIIVSLPWGEGPGDVGLVQPEEGLARGPEAFAIAEDGRMVVLDSVNRRLLILTPDGHVDRSVPVGLREPRFVALTRDTVWVVDADSDRQATAYSWSGEQIEVRPVPQFDDPATAAFAQGDLLWLETGHSDCHQLPSVRDERTQLGTVEQAGRPARANAGQRVSARFALGGLPEITLTTGGTRSTSGDRRLQLTSSRALECLVSIDTDLNGDMAVGARLLSPAMAAGGTETPSGLGRGSAAGGSLLVTRISGALDPVADSPEAGWTCGSTASILLTDNSLAYVGQPYVYGPDGRVYQPMALDAGYVVLVHVFPEGGES